MKKECNFTFFLNVYMHIDILVGDLILSSVIRVFNFKHVVCLWLL